jgi:hypothetical protein
MIMYWVGWCCCFGTFTALLIYYYFFFTFLFFLSCIWVQQSTTSCISFKYNSFCLLKKKFLTEIAKNKRGKIDKVIY